MTKEQGSTEKKYPTFGPNHDPGDASSVRDAERVLCACEEVDPGTASAVHAVLGSYERIGCDGRQKRHQVHTAEVNVMLVYVR